MEMADIEEKEGWVRDRLEKILTKLPSLDCTVDQAISQCKAGRWMLITDGDEDGFVMVSSRVHLDGKRCLYIEMGYHMSKERDMGYYLPFLKSLASHWGAQYIEFSSQCKGWEWHGFKPVATIYRQEV